MKRPSKKGIERLCLSPAERQTWRRRGSADEPGRRVMACLFRELLLWRLAWGPQAVVRFLYKVRTKVLLYWTAHNGLRFTACLRRRIIDAVVLEVWGNALSSLGTDGGSTGDWMRSVNDKDNMTQSGRSECKRWYGCSVFLLTVVLYVSVDQTINSKKRWRRRVSKIFIIVLPFIY